MNVNLNLPKELFNPVYLPYLNTHDKRYEIYYGGSGSGKSVFVVQKKIVNILKDPGRNILVVRKVAKDNRHSTFAEIVKMINRWECESLFGINKSDMSITCLNGNQIMFAGLDDVGKLKSITFQNGILTDVWIEEADQITQEDFEILDLRLRGLYHLSFNITFSFNPISALSWIKKEFFDVKRDDTFILKTTYLQNNFCDEAYKKKLERLKDKNYTLYQIYALGEWGVLGELVFQNYIMRDFDIEPFQELAEHGLDFGFNDPSAWIEACIYDQEIYILREFYRSELTNNDLISEIEKIHNKKDLIIADSAEPARIKEFQRHGFRIIGAEKGKSSVKSGIDFIQRHRINIHPSCINFLSEVQSYSYKKDKNGRVFDEPVDFNDHLISTLRYAFERRRKHKYLKAMNRV